MRTFYLARVQFLVSLNSSILFFLKVLKSVFLQFCPFLFFANYSSILFFQKSSNLSFTILPIFVFLQIVILLFLAKDDILSIWNREIRYLLWSVFWQVIKCTHTTCRDLQMFICQMLGRSSFAKLSSWLFCQNSPLRYSSNS